MSKNLMLVWLLIASLTVSCQKITTPVASPTTPLYFSEEANTLFSSLFPNVNMNSGITIERAKPVLSSQINDIGFAVFNYTEEPITFPNQGFGVKVFGYDERAKLWSDLNLPQIPYQSSIELPAKIDKWSLAGPYMWSIPKNASESLRREKIRVYI